MPYARRFNYKGPETVWNNLLAILARDIPSELREINSETGQTLANFAGYLKAETSDPPDSFILVEPDTTDAIETEDSSSLDSRHVFSITFAKKVGSGEAAGIEQLTRDILRYDRAVRNVLWSMTGKTVGTRIGLCTGITCTPPSWDVTPGRVRWGMVGNVRLRTMVGVKLVVDYNEIAVTGA